MSAPGFILRFVRDAQPFRHKRRLSTANQQSTGASALSRAAELCRTPILHGKDAVAGIGAFVKQHLSTPVGTRCIVVTSPSGAKRAAIVSHFLRKAGLFPLVCELSDSAPLTAHTAAALAGGKRTGAQLVVGFGSSAAISVGRATAALLANGGKAEQYLPLAGGKLSVSQPSIPFLAVPTCPTSMELTRQSVLLAEGRTLAYMTPLATSPQACLSDPSLLSTCPPEHLLPLAVTALVHASEGYTRTDDGATGKGRPIAWEGVRMAVAGLLSCMHDPRSIAGAHGRACLMLSSLYSSYAVASGPLGPARALALNTSARFNIPYSTVSAAVAPHLLPNLASTVLGHAEDIADSAGWHGLGSRAEAQAERKKQIREDKQKDLEDDWSDNLDALESGSSRAGKPFGRRASPTFGGSRSLRAPTRAKGSKGEDKELDDLLKGYAKAMQEEKEAEEAGRREEESTWSEEDDDMLACAKRWAHVAQCIEQGMEMVQAGSAKDAGLQLPIPGHDWSHIQGNSRGALSPSEVASLNAFSSTLEGVLHHAISTAGGEVQPPVLADYGLSEADLGAIAAGAEVDDNTLACLVKLRRPDLLEILRQA